MATYVSSKMPKCEHDITVKLNSHLKKWGGFTTQRGGVKGTNVSKWHEPDEQKRILKKGLMGLWLLARTSVAFDGTPEGFVKIFLFSEFGDPLIRAYMSWRSVVSKLLNNAVRTTNWACPRIAIVINPKLETKTDQVVFGRAPIELIVNWLWLRRLVEFTSYPTDPIKKVACARLIMFTFTWAVIIKYGCRVHCVEKIGVVTVDEYKSLEPKHWNFHELQYGVWIVHDAETITLHINDSKKITNPGGKQRDQQLFSDFHYEDEIKVSGVYQNKNDWFEKMFASIVWAYDVLAPRGRVYTTNIWNMETKSFKEAPMFYCPTPKTPTSSLMILQIDQSRYKNTDGTPIDSFKELVIAAKNATHISKRRAITCPDEIAALKRAGVTLPMFPSRPDKSLHQGSKASASSDTNSMYNVQMVDLVSQFGASKFKLRNIESRFSWKFDAYLPKPPKSERKSGASHTKTSVKQYEFQKAFKDRRDLNGCEKLFGGFFDLYDVDSLTVLANGCRKKELLMDLKAPRHSNIACHVWAQEFLSNFIANAKMTKRQKQEKQQRILHPLETCFKNAQAVLAEKEVHFSTETIDTSYCDMMHRCQICKPAQAFKQCMIGDEQTYVIKKLIWSHRSMKNARGEFLKDAIDIGGDGISHWPTTMAPSYATEEHEGTSILSRCHDFQLLSPMEQMEVLWTLSAFRTFLDNLHEGYASFCDNKELVKLWRFVKEISIPPSDSGRLSSPRSKKKSRIL